MQSNQTLANPPFAHPNLAMRVNPPLTYTYPNLAMSDPSINILYQGAPSPIAMPLYNCNSGQSVQRIPWSELQNSGAMMYYYNELLRRDQHQRMSTDLNPPKDTNYGTRMGSALSRDEFMMYHFKIQQCPHYRGHHDWTDCLFLHQGEKARRRDPRKCSYSGKPCVDFRKRGQCENGDGCQFAHGVFETWLHPDKYKTQMCRDLSNCQRKVCFFAHSAEELREGDGVIEDISDALSPKSIFSVDETPPRSPPQLGTHHIVKDMERLRLSTVDNAAYQCTVNEAKNVEPQYIASEIMHKKLYHNNIWFELKQNETQIVEEPNLDWVVELLD
jgi:hypothetical protein